MGNLFWQSITDPLRITCNVLAFIIPYVVYRLNVRLQRYGNPPWKKEQNEQSSTNGEKLE